MNVLMVKLYQITDHTPTNVDNFKRFVAFVIDWFLGYLCIAAPSALIWLNQTKDAKNLVTNLSELGTKLGSEYAYIAAIGSVIITIIYYVILPWKRHGQTVGKRMMGLRIVNIDDTDASLKALCIRGILAVMIIEGYICPVSEMVRQLLLLQGWTTVYMVLGFVAIAISAFSIFLGFKFASHRMIHDYIAKTKVINVEESQQ